MESNPYQSPAAETPPKPDTKEMIRKGIMKQVALNIGIIVSLGVTEIGFIIALQKEKMNMDQITTASIIAVTAAGILGGINSLLMFRNSLKLTKTKGDSPKN